MNGIEISIIAYCLLAIESLANKFLIVGKVRSWRLYLFYVGLLSLTGLAFIPWGFYWPNKLIFFWSFLSGVVFFCYLSVLFSALKKWTASRVFVLMGAVTTLITLLIAHFFLQEKFTQYDWWGIVFLILGGFFISYRYNKVRLFRGYKRAILAGVLLAVYFSMIKQAYNLQLGTGYNFVTVYVFSRLGISITTFLIFLWPPYRHRLFKLLKERKKKDHLSGFGWTTLIKLLSGVASIMLIYAISVGKVTIINALSSVQYLFIFIFSLIISFFWKNHLKENLEKKNIFYKMLGVLGVVVGIIFIMI